MNTTKKMKHARRVPNREKSLTRRELSERELAAVRGGNDLTLEVDCPDL